MNLTYRYIELAKRGVHDVEASGIYSYHGAESINEDSDQKISLVTSTGRSK